MQQAAARRIGVSGRSPDQVGRGSRARSARGPTPLTLYRNFRSSGSASVTLSFRLSVAGMPCVPALVRVRDACIPHREQRCDPGGTIVPAGVYPCSTKVPRASQIRSASRLTDSEGGRKRSHTRGPKDR